MPVFFRKRGFERFDRGKMGGEGFGGHKIRGEFLVILSVSEGSHEILLSSRSPAMCGTKGGKGFRRHKRQRKEGLCIPLLIFPAKTV
jgi:hypothetical protein